MKLPKHFAPHKPVSLDSFDQLKNYPYIVQPKLDGLRAIITDGKILTNSLKPFPNKHLKAFLEPLTEAYKQSYFEGEFIIEGGNLQDVQSALMSRDCELPKTLRLVLFDRLFDDAHWNDLKYSDRLHWLCDILYFCAPSLLPNIKPVWDWSVNNQGELEEIEQVLVVKQKHEGIIIRNPRSTYKFGRATAREDSFWKFKRTEDAEAEILETIPLEHNTNESKTNERGYTERSSAKAGKVSSDMAGSLLVGGINGKYRGKIFFVSLGSATANVRRWFLKTSRDNSGRIITYTYAKYRGTEDAPAEPRWKAFRDPKDLTTT